MSRLKRSSISKEYRRTCTACKKSVINPSGPIKANILLLGAFPGKEEFKYNAPWSGNAGDLLKGELRRAGITYGACRATNMWMHWKPHTHDDLYEECLDFNRSQMFKELQGRRAVLLMGSDVVSFFCRGYSVSELNGLEVESEFLPKSVEVAVACFNPASALRGSIGETRLAIQKFGKLTREMR